MVDVVYVAAAGAALTLAASRSRRWAWLLSGTIALWLTPTTFGRLAAIAAISLALAAVYLGRRRIAGAAVGTLLAGVLGSLGSGPFTGSTTLFALLAGSPLMLSGALLMPARWRRPIARGLGATVAAAVLATVAFGVSALLSLDDVNNGTDAANIGFDQVAAGNQENARQAFDSSSASFAAAHDRVTGFWALPARLVPIVGQHARAVQVVTAEGVALTEIAVDTANSIDPNDIRLTDGAIDLGLLQDLEPVLVRAERALDRAHDRVDGSRTDWLVSPLANRIDDLLAELDSARPSARIAALAVKELPTMLGVEGPVRWLVAMTTPAEARGLGGLLGNWALIEANDGRVSIVLSGRNEDVNERLRARGIPLVGPEQYIDRWGNFRPNEFFQDVTLSPDLPMTAEVTASLFSAAMDLDVDGVIFLDPYAVAGILALGGPVNVEGRTLTANNVVSFILEDQYAEFDGDEEGRVRTLAALVDGAFTGVTTGELPGPRAIADVLGPVIEQDRLGLWWRDGGDVDQLIDAAGLDGRFPDIPADLVGVVHQNAGQNKLDTYLQRAIDYSLTIENGRATGRIRVTLTNTLDDLTLPSAVIANNDQGFELGTNVARLYIHSALGLVAARLDGEAFAVGREQAFGHDAIEAVVEVPPGETRVLEIDLVGVLDVDAEHYSLTLPYQPLVNDDTVSLDVTIDGQVLDLGDPFTLTRDRVISTHAN